MTGRLAIKLPIAVLDVATGIGLVKLGEGGEEGELVPKRVNRRRQSPLVLFIECHSLGEDYGMAKETRG